MKHVMLDLETLGTSPGCVILSIGAVVFDLFDGLGATFYVVLNGQSQQAVGLHEDPATLIWWAKQSEAARQVISEAALGVDVKPALETFTRWLAMQGREVYLWGNGSDFDNAILAYVYQAVGLEQPWKFWHNRCYRTLKHLDKRTMVGKRGRVGVYHNALDDAKTQALNAIEIMRHL